MTTTPTFQSVFDEKKNDRIKSDLSNLAHALLSVQQAKADIDKLEEAIKATAAQVEAGQTPDFDIQQLYQKAQNLGFNTGGLIVAGSITAAKIR